MHTFQQKVTMLGSLSCGLRAQVNIFHIKLILIDIFGVLEEDITAVINYLKNLLVLAKSHLLRLYLRLNPKP
jgi:hypothetical protein